ncbi:MAG TPA: cupin domain-containing protein [Methylocystis sp.]
MTMNNNKIVFHDGKNVEMTPCPVNPAWVIDGMPVARNFVLSRSLDNSSTTLLWDCTKGVFNWYYDIDETVYVLEGSVVVTDDNGVEHHLGPGDHALFRAGSHAVWRVEKYVRKVAFCRNPVPAPVMFAVRVVKKLARMMKLSAGASDAPAMFNGV